jgi:hypothetical protein
MADPKQVTKITETHTTITQTQGNPLPAPAGSAPITNTLSATWVSTNTARLEGEVTPGKAPTLYWFEYGTTPNLGMSTAPLSAGDGESVVPVSAVLPDLDRTGMYQFRLVAENKYGKVAGALHTLQATQAKAVEPAHEEVKPGWFSNILAIVGFVIILVIVIWGLIHFALLISPSLSSLFSSKAKTPAALHVSAPANATSGTPFTVTWTYAAPTKGSYALVYPCNSSLTFDTVDGKQIPCGAAYIASTSSIAVSPVLTGTATINEPLTIIFLPSTTGVSQAQGSATVAVGPAAQKQAPAPTPTPTPTKPTYNTPSGPSDLSVSIVSATVDQYGNGTVVFDITNIGGSSSGTYYFTAQLPTRTGYAYTSPAQVSLAPQSHIVSTLRFTQAISGVFSVSVGAQDANQANNYASATLSAPYYDNTNYNYTNNPQPYYQPYVY